MKSYKIWLEEKENKTENIEIVDVDDDSYFGGKTQSIYLRTKNNKAIVVEPERDGTIAVRYTQIANMPKLSDKSQPGSKLGRLVKAACVGKKLSLADLRNGKFGTIKVKVMSCPHPFTDKVIRYMNPA